MINVCLLLDLYVTLYPMSTSAGQHLEPVRQQMQRPGKKVSFRLHLFLLLARFESVVYIKYNPDSAVHNLLKNLQS